MSNLIPATSRGGFRLTKSSYLIGRQCPLRLWLRSRGVSEAPPEIDDYYDPAEDFEEQARLVELIAEQLFPGGVAVEGIEGAPLSTASADRTAKLMADDGAPAILRGSSLRSKSEASSTSCVGMATVGSFTR